MASFPTAKPEPIIQYRERTAQFYPEERLTLTAEQMALEMVYLPQGSFVMGSPDNELGRNKSESPQHLVTISQPFFMGKYPITQAQWHCVAQMPEIGHALNSKPSYFTGDNRPVERINWYDAVEFCRRLEKLTGRPYRLPSEAEWEYACRAGTETPFHFGVSITTDLANYKGGDLERRDQIQIGSGAYRESPHGQFRQETTDVGSFGVANAFGLLDMHGNVLEWCQDTWHGTYEEAPTDGCAWMDDNDYRVLRGGSWVNNPEDCRSADRGFNRPDFRSFRFGLRVVCGFART